MREREHRGSRVYREAMFWDNMETVGRRDDRRHSTIARTEESRGSEHRVTIMIIH